MSLNDGFSTNKETIETFAAEKERLIEQYRAKCDAIQKEIDALNIKKDKLNDSIKKEYAKRLNTIEEKEAYLKEEQKKLDELTRMLDERSKEIEEKAIASNRESEEAMQKAVEINRQIGVQLIDIAYQKESIDLLNIVNGKVVEEINEKLESLKDRQTEIGITKANLDKQQINIDSKINENNEILNKIEVATKESRSALADLLIKENDIRQAIEEQAKLKEETINAINELTLAKVELDKLKAANDDQIRVITAANDKIRTETIANKAKEIQLNDKERALNERERNIKIMESQQ